MAGHGAMGVAMILGLLCAGPLPAMAQERTPQAPQAAQAGAGQLPAEVRAFIARRQGCDHFRGEEPYDAARAAQINAALKQLCTGTDAELARLKRRYAKHKAVARALAGFETAVE